MKYPCVFIFTVVQFCCINRIYNCPTDFVLTLKNQRTNLLAVKSVHQLSRGSELKDEQLKLQQ